jgi:hypothetical protein
MHTAPARSTAAVRRARRYGPLALVLALSSQACALPVEADHSSARAGASDSEEGSPGAPVEEIGTVGAELNTPTRPTQSIGAALPPEIRAIGDSISEIAGFISTVSGGIGSAISILQMLNILPMRESEELMRLRAIEAKLDRMYVSLVGEVRAAAFWAARRDMARALSDLQGASFAVDQWARSAAASSNPDAARFESIGSGTNEVLSRNAALFLADDIHFKQPMVAAPLANSGLGDTTPSVDANGLAFDYRLAAPALLTAIALRLKVIFAVDPRFVDNANYDAELSVYARRLRAVHDQMVSGIRCLRGYGTWDLGPGGRWRTVRNATGSATVWEDYDVTIGTVCADIHSGASVRHEMTGRFPGQTLFDGNFLPLRNGTMDPLYFGPTTSNVPANVLNTLWLREHHPFDSGYAHVNAATRAQLLHRMGAHHLREMADLLEALIDGNRSLTMPSYDAQRVGMIQTRLDGSCLAVRGAAIGGNVVIEPCQSGGSRARQAWSYDRTTGQVRSELGGCLAVDVNGWDALGKRGVYGPDSYSEFVPGAQRTRYVEAIARGARITTRTCTTARGTPRSGPPSLEADAETWSFDSRTGRLHNALGGGSLVLDVQWGRTAPGTPVWLWDIHPDIHTSAAQQWFTYDRIQLPRLNIDPCVLRNTCGLLGGSGITLDRILF